MNNKNNYLKIIIIIGLLTIALAALVYEFSILQKVNSDEETYNIVINSRRELLKSNVDRTITDIELLQGDVELSFDIYSQMLCREIVNGIERGEHDDMDLVISRTTISEFHKELYLETQHIYKDMRVTIYDSISKSLKYTNDYNDNTDFDKFLLDNESRKIITTMSAEHYDIYVYLENEVLENVTIERIKPWIRNLRVEGSEYIWVNKVVDYDGGQDYAVRLIHPNLPETEGILLSTEIEDLKGNKPYLKELEGVIEQGEIYQNYFFKEFSEETISEKMSYAKLYEPYDWIIATGIYMNDIEELYDIEKSNEKKIEWISYLIFASILVILVMSYFGFKVVENIKVELKEQDKQHTFVENEMESALNVAQDMAYKDTLTDLLNRRGLFDRLEDEMSRARRQGYDLTLLMADIDYFKNINDSYGHDCGDEALIYLAKIMKSSTRKEDIIGRLGGDEMLMIIPYLNTGEAKILAEKISLHLKNEAFNYKGIDIKMSLSVGITAMLSDDNVDTIIKRADIGMYQSKRNGKDKITIFRET